MKKRLLSLLTAAEQQSMMHERVNVSVSSFRCSF